MSVTGGDRLARHALRLCDGFGSSLVVYSNQTTRGHLDYEETVIDGPQGLVHSSVRTVTVPTAAFRSTPTRDSTITVDGTDYKVREALPQGDGRHLRIEVA